MQNSFDTLEPYIQSQKAFLPAPSDVDRLRLSREQVATRTTFYQFRRKGFLTIFDALRQFVVTNHSSTITSSTLITNLIPQRRFKTRSIGTYSKDKVRHLTLFTILIIC